MKLFQYTKQTIVPVVWVTNKCPLKRRLNSSHLHFGTFAGVQSGWSFPK